MSTVAVQRSKTYDIVYIAVFAVIMAICSWISIPAAVPFTLQTFGVFIAAGVLGGKRGTLSVLVFILLGAVGIPVFANFSGGIGVLVGPTGSARYSRLYVPVETSTPPARRKVRFLPDTRQRRTSVRPLPCSSPSR